MSGWVEDSTRDQPLIPPAHAGGTDFTLTEQKTLEQWTETDRQMMTRALELAAQGTGQVSPGPLVGTVIVDAAGEIAGEGFYLFDQVKHAETTALERAGERARGATAYVSRGRE